MEKLGVEVNKVPKAENDNVSCALRKAFIGGFFTQIAYCTGKHYVTVRESQTVEIHPGSVLKHKPEWILYHELVLTDKNFLRTCTAVRPEWLLEICPQFFPDSVNQDEALKSLKRAGERYGFGKKPVVAKKAAVEESSSGEESSS